MGFDLQQKDTWYYENRYQEFAVTESVWPGFPETVVSQLTDEMFTRWRSGRKSFLGRESRVCKGPVAENSIANKGALKRLERANKHANNHSTGLTEKLQGNWDPVYNKFSKWLNCNFFWNRRDKVPWWYFPWKAAMDSEATLNILLDSSPSPSSQLDTNAPLGLWYLGQGPGRFQSRSNIKNHTESAKREEAAFKTVVGFYWESFRWKLSSSSPARERRASCRLRERADESGTLVDQSACACEQVYGGNEGFYLFGKTLCGLIARREECVKQQLGGCWPGFSGRGRQWGSGLPFHLQPPCRGNWGKLCSHLRTVCISSGWAAVLQTRVDGAALAPVFGETWEGN